MKAVNLLPTDSKTPKTSNPAGAGSPASSSGSGAGAFAVLGALAFTVVAIAAYVLTTNTIKDRTAELERVKADTVVVQSQLAALKPYADFQTVATQRVATVTQLARGRFDWEQALRDLSRAIPTNVRLKTLKGTVGGGAAGGVSGLRGARQAPAFELSGCARNQATVARLMSRLKTVRGVTRVSLSKSERPAPAVAGAGTVAVGDTQELLCGKGRPPAFEVIVFFERSQVLSPTSVPGASTPSTSGAGQAQGPTGQSGAQPPQVGSATAPNTTGVSAP